MPNNLTSVVAMSDGGGATISSDCWIIVYHSDDIQSEYLPMYPDEVSDSQSAIWSSQQIIGRSSPIVAYTGTDARKISFNMTLHREMSTSYKYKDDIEDIIKLIRSALYPKYMTVGLIPPKIRVVLGELAVDGILENASFNWKKPIIDKKYMVCDVGMQITGYPSTIQSKEDIYPANGISDMNPGRASTNYR